MFSSILAVALFFSPTYLTTHRADACATQVKNAPSWMNCSERNGKIKLIGQGNWAAQPVVDRVKVKLTGKVRKLLVDKGMLASLNVRGTKKSDKVEFGAQAGTITKRTRSVISFGNDTAKDVFIFTNTTKSHGPFNHAQNIVIKQFGKEDKIKLKNIGKTFGYNDVRGDGSLPGVPVTAIKVEKL